LIYELDNSLLNGMKRMNKSGLNNSELMCVLGGGGRDVQKWYSISVGSMVAGGGAGVHISYYFIIILILFYKIK
jgi:hypothetical protein